MPTPTDRPDISLVLEYENAVSVSAERVAEVVQTLARQVREAPFAVEVLVPENANFDMDALAGLPVRQFHVLPDAGYYAVKNAGAREAHGQVIVLADCDVIPLDGWLVNLVRPLEDPTVDAVVGNTIIRPAPTVSDKAFAASTWFPADEQDARQQIIASNLAFRPSLFLPDGFPDVGCRLRGADRDLDRAWAARGVRMEVALDARGLHPPPAHPIQRALWDGHDQQITQRASGAAFVPFLARIMLHQLLVGSVRIFQSRGSVGLRRTQLPLALACNLREAAARGAGFTLARFSHELFHRRMPK